MLKGLTWGGVYKRRAMLIGNIEALIKNETDWMPIEDVNPRSGEI